MEVAKVIVNGNTARVIDRNPITKDMRGATIRVEYVDPVWDGLRKTVVFDGVSVVGFLCDSEVVEIPPEVVEKAGGVLRFGVCGTNGDGALVIPTTWADLGTILDGVPLEFNPPGAPGPSLWMQILGMIGDLKNLTTDARDNLVNAINELAGKGGGRGPGGYYTPVISQENAGAMTVSYVPSEDGMPDVDPVQITLPVGPKGDGGVGIASISIEEV